MKENQKKVFEKIFEMDFKKEPVNLLEELEEDINKENEIQLEETVIEDTKEIILDYKMENRLDRSLILSIAAGLPTEEFLKAEYIYRQMEDREGQEERKTVYKYYLEGSLLAGSLAQYAAIMSEGFVEQYQTITYNAIGLENFLEFHGNEFLGLKAGLLYYLDDLCNNNKRSMMKTILYRLEDEGIIKYGNISDEYRTHDGEILQGDYIKEVLIDVFRESLEIDLEGAKELVNTHFKSEIVERKMRFIDRYRLYQKKYEEKNDRIINYVFSENLPAQLFRQIGSTYIIDSNLVKQDDELRNNFINRIEVINEEKLENFKEHSIDIFEPFVLLKENGNGVNARNRLKERAKINEITDMLSQDYLKAAIKDIVIELDKKDRSLLVDIFKKCQSSKEDEFVNLIIDRLLYSRYLKGLINESELKYSSRFLKDNPDFFANCNKTYPLDRVIIEQLKKMPAAEIRELWDWKVSADGIFLILGSETEEDNIFEYHSETNPLDNKLEEIKLELNEPSNNRIYGSEK
ncbi:MAG: hypothetical protein GX175_04740, partial [Halanaerobiaceae bacterium]|nr:hypothetical protein [Halanaerobiaceae bacterium]